MKWEDDGAWLGECMMRNTGESPNAAVESRLSQILEETPQEKYSLSAKACQGILRRAERRGKDLPEPLKTVLLMQSENAECGWNKPSVVVPAVLCLNDQGGNVMGVSHDVSGTLRAQEHGHQPSILDMSHACDVIRDCGEIAPSLQGRMGTGGNQVPLTYQMQGFGDYREGDVASSCKQRDFKDSPDLVCSVDCRNFTEGGEINGTLQAKESGGQSLNLNNTVRQNMVVRRLTPLECERLQGFPDGWTDIGDWVKTGKRGRRIKVKGSADSPRYKALGNSIALPFWDFLAKRISAQYLRPVTMGSLFDGIGGFPLVFERHNGKGTARWASEIEEFPIAVTKLRFGED
jgi:DNA (cytosine-5)-methyltransferase 1